MSVIDFIRNFHDLKRMEKILLVFLEEGFGAFISKINLGKHLPFHKRVGSKLTKSTNQAPVRLRKAFERLGPTFIKFGQILSLRPDLVPYDYVLEFEKMQDKVPQFPFSQVKSTVEKELGKPMNKVFKNFDKKPIASASISQVHKATLKNGKVVAVKVKRPGVDNLMKTDIRLMHHVAKLIDKHDEELQKYKIPKIIAEFERWTNKELKFKLEAANAITFRRNFRNSKDIVFPQIYTDYTTDNLIVMEYLNGIPLHDFETIKKKFKNTHKLITKGYAAIIKQVFADGFYHADPHPGNILVLKNGKLAFLDFGIVGKFDDKLKRNSADIFLGILEDDLDTVVKAFTKFGVAKDFDEYEFRRDLKEVFDPVFYSDISAVEVSLVLEHAINLASRYEIRIPRDYVLFGKTLVTLEGIGLKYDTGFKFIPLARPMLRKLVIDRHSSKNLRKSLKKKAYQYSGLLSEFPEKADKFLDMVGKGSISVDIEDTDVRNLTVEMEKSAGNVALGFIVAALIVGSALIWQIDQQPFTYGQFPLIPIMGLAFAAFLGLWVVHRTIFVKILR